MGLTVHHLGVSQSERVVWVCEELGLDYTMVKHDRSPIFSPPELVALHPIGQAPVIQDGPDIKIAESAACIEYICQKYGKGRFIVKPDEKNYADYLYWFHFANGTMQPAFMSIMYLSSAGIGPDNPRMKSTLAKKDKILKMVDERLGQTGAYLAGDELTTADIMSVVCFTGMRCFMPYDLTGYDNILAYLQRIKAREGYRRAMAKGDPDQDINLLTGAAPPPMQKGIAAVRKAAAASKV